MIRFKSSISKQGKSKIIRIPDAMHEMIKQYEQQEQVLVTVDSVKGAST